MSDPGGDKTTSMSVENGKQEPTVIEKSTESNDQEPTVIKKSKDSIEAEKSKSPMETEKSNPPMQKEKSESPKKDMIRLDSKKNMLRQVEYYFSDSNLHRDKFMNDILEENDGWVPIKKLLTFPRVKQMVEEVETEIPGINSVEHFVESLRSSKELLRVSDDGERVQRAIPLLDPKVIAERTVAVFGFPTKRKFYPEEQRMFWGQFGGVISVRRYVPYSGRSRMCVIFVEFDSKKIAQEVIESEMVDYDGIELTIRAREQHTPRKRKRVVESNEFKPDKLLKVSEYPAGTKWFEVKRWLENNDLRDIFVHYKDDDCYVRLKGELSATEIAKKLENKPWSSKDERIVKVEAIEDGEYLWKALVKSLPPKIITKKSKRGGPMRLEKKDGVSLEKKKDGATMKKSENHFACLGNITNETGDATKMEEDS